MNNTQRYINSIENENSTKVAKSVLKNVTVPIETFTQAEIEHWILEQCPNSPKAIITICYALGAYGDWLQSQGITKNDSFQRKLLAIDKKALWKKAKPNARKKFISYDELEQTIADIHKYEEYNKLYYATIFRSIFEGIYNDDLSALKNLRSSDINGTIVTLHEDSGNTYDLEITEKLAHDLIELSKVPYWERENRYGLCRVELVGPYPDSVFKYEKRKTNTDKSNKFVYYAKLRRIADNYVGHKTLPLELYISGIMYRVKCQLQKYGISLQDAFSHQSRNRTVHEILSSELTRCNRQIEVGNFRELVCGHLDSF